MQRPSSCAGALEDLKAATDADRALGRLLRVTRHLVNPLETPRIRVAVAAATRPEGMGDDSRMFRRQLTRETCHVSETSATAGSAATQEADAHARMFRRQLSRETSSLETEHPAAGAKELTVGNLARAGSAVLGGSQLSRISSAGLSQDAPIVRRVGSPLGAKNARQPRVVLITGASKGYGRALAMAFSAEAEKSRRTTELLLVARDSVGLEQTAQALHGFASRAPHVCLHMDLASADAVMQQTGQLLEMLSEALVRVSRQQPEQTRAAELGPELIVIHNAGSLGQLAYCQSIRGEEVKSSTELNVTSFMLLNNAILQRFSSGTSYKIATPAPEQRFSRITLVNVSSLVAVEAFPSWSLYAVSKAARDMAMRVVAKEADALGQSVKSLNWAPGPMRTSMTDEILQTCPDQGVLTMFKNMELQNTFVDVDASASKLVQLLNEDTYESGSHIDFYDV